jgi:hypothetical protein
MSDGQGHGPGRELPDRTLDGKIAHVTDAPSADTHLIEMKEAAEKLK